MSLRYLWLGSGGVWSAICSVHRARRVAGILSAVVLCGAVALAALPALAAAEGCPNATFRTGPSAGLPDCRAYEMVSPAYTNQSGVAPLSIGPEGNSMTVGALTGFAGVEGDEGIDGGIYSLTRAEGSGWGVTPMSLPASRFVHIESFGSFLSAVPTGTGTVAFMARSSSEPPNAVGVYERHADGSIVYMGPALPPSAPEDGNPGEEPSPVGISDDGSHVFFEVSAADAWPAAKGHSGLYEYAGAGNSEPLLVGVNNTGEPLSECETEIGSIRSEVTHNAVSADGRIVFFTAAACGDTIPVNELFARIDNGEPDARTVAISEPSAADCSACNTEAGVLANAEFEGASEDGSKAFFMTNQPLLGSDTSVNLYEYDFDAPAGERVTRLSAGDSTVSSPTADLSPEVSGLAGSDGYGAVVQVSEDGSHVYFVGRGVLTSKPNDQGQRAQPGADNLYVVREDPADSNEHETAFITDLCSEVGASGEVSDGRCPHNTAAEELGYDVRLWAGFDQSENADVSPDGRFLVFVSYGDLTEDDTSSTDQVFEYDAQTEQLVRVSIGQGGFDDNGNTNTTFAEAQIASPHFVSSDVPVEADPAMYWSHLTLSADGSRVFFTSPDALTEGALNDVLLGGEACLQEERERCYANNVYEYHSLNGNIAEGNVYLISDGRDIHTAGAGETAVRLLGTDATGQDVFFSTLDDLIPGDTSEVGSIFDARIDGGFPAPVAAPSCAGDACQGSLGAAPTLLSPGSEFQAAANPPSTGTTTPASSSVKPKPKPKKAVKRKKPKKTAKNKGKGKAGKSSTAKRPARHGKARRVAARNGGRI